MVSGEGWQGWCSRVPEEQDGYGVHQEPISLYNWSSSLFFMCGWQPCYCPLQQGGPGCHSHSPFPQDTLQLSLSLPTTLSSHRNPQMVAQSQLEGDSLQKERFPQSAWNLYPILCLNTICFLEIFLGFFLSSFSPEGPWSYSALWNSHVCLYDSGHTASCS